MDLIISKLTAEVSKQDFPDAKTYYNNAHNLIDTWETQGLISPNLAKDMQTELGTYYQQSQPLGDKDEAEKALEHLVTDIKNA